MTLQQKISGVKRVYRHLSIHSSAYKKAAGIGCPAGCSLCCTKPDIEATVLEFLPAAYELYLDGTIEKVLNDLESRQDPVCYFYNPLSAEGGCTIYQYRGMICRLFGYSTKSDKHGSPTLVTCKIIKSQKSQDELKVSIDKAPQLSSYYLKLFGIDQKLAIQYFPINEAVKRSLELVLFHFQFRKKPA